MSSAPALRTLNLGNNGLGSLRKRHLTYWSAAREARTSPRMIVRSGAVPPYRGASPTRVSVATQLVSQVLPSSSENACSKRIECWRHVRYDEAY